jgi:hypothetical protein
MLSLTYLIQLEERMLYHRSSWKVWRLQIKEQAIRALKYADDLVLQVKEETVIQNMIDKLIEIGSCYGIEMNVE